MSWQHAKCGITGRHCYHRLERWSLLSFLLCTDDDEDDEDGQDDEDGDEDDAHKFLGKVCCIAQWQP